MFKYIVLISALSLGSLTSCMENKKDKIVVPKLAYLDISENIKLAGFYEENNRGIIACKINNEHEKKSKHMQLSSNMKIYIDACLSKTTNVTFDDISNTCPACWGNVSSENKDDDIITLRSCGFKFHTVCLFQWISVSNTTTCPLLCENNEKAT